MLLIILLFDNCLTITLHPLCGLVQPANYEILTIIDTFNYNKFNRGI